jgi:hypothetical protein
VSRFLLPERTFEITSIERPLVSCSNGLRPALPVQEPGNHMCGVSLGSRKLLTDSLRAFPPGLCRAIEISRGRAVQDRIGKELLIGIDHFEGSPSSE